MSHLDDPHARPEHHHCDMGVATWGLLGMTVLAIVIGLIWF